MPKGKGIYLQQFATQSGPVRFRRGQIFEWLAKNASVALHRCTGLKGQAMYDVLGHFSEMIMSSVLQIAHLVRLSQG